MPLNPATIRATAQRVDIPAMYDAARPDFPGVMFHPFSKLNEENAAFMRQFGHAAVAVGIDLAAQSHATALADAEREAARRAWEACSAMVVGYTNLDARDGYLARAHPAPATREVVKCALCRQPGADLSTGTHNTRDECIEALGKAFATTEGAR